MSFCRHESHRRDLAGPALLFWICQHHPFWFFCPKPLEAEDHFEALDWDSLLIETIYAARKYLTITISLYPHQLFYPNPLDLRYPRSLD